MTLTLRSLAVTSTFVALFAAGVSQASAEAPKPCIKAKQQTAQVQAACDAGGLDGAKKMMKGLVDKAKAAGKETKCNNCHQNLKTFELTPNGLDDLKKML